MSEFQVYAKLNGEGFTAWELNKQTHQGVDFQCPYCGSTMRPVMGKIRRWHFRHLVKGKCIGGGESEFHYRMKYWFVLKAKEHGIEYFVEKSVKDISAHRPDVILFLNEPDKKLLNCDGVAIEFQNSPIDFSSIKDRNVTFLNQNLTPWWIFGGKHYHKIQSNILKKGINPPDIFLKLFEDFEKITFLEDDGLYYLEYSDSESIIKKDVDFLSALKYHQGRYMPDLEGSLRKYLSKKRGFFLKKRKKWIGYPKILKQYQNTLERRINSLEEKIDQVKSRVTKLQKRSRNINSRLNGIDNHPYFYKYYLNKYLTEINEKGQISYQESIKFLIGLGLDQTVAKNIIEYLLRHNQIFKQETFILSIRYLEKVLEKQKIIVENRTKSVYFKEQGKTIQVPVWLTPEMERGLIDYIVFEIAIYEWNCMVWLRENVDKTMSRHNAHSVLRYLEQIGKISFNPKDGRYYPA